MSPLEPMGANEMAPPSDVDEESEELSVGELESPPLVPEGVAVLTKVDEPDVMVVTSAVAVAEALPLPLPLLPLPVVAVAPALAADVRK